MANPTAAGRQSTNAKPIFLSILLVVAKLSFRSFTPDALRAAFRARGAGLIPSRGLFAIACFPAAIALHSGEILDIGPFGAPVWGRSEPHSTGSVAERKEIQAEWAFRLSHDLSREAVVQVSIAADGKVLMVGGNSGGVYTLAPNGADLQYYPRPRQGVGTTRCNDRCMWSGGGSFIRISGACTDVNCEVVFYEDGRTDGVTRSFPGRYLCRLGNKGGNLVKGIGVQLAVIDDDGEEVRRGLPAPIGGVKISRVVAGRYASSGMIALLVEYWPSNDGRGSRSVDGRSAIQVYTSELKLVRSVPLPEVVDNRAFGIDYDGNSVLVREGGRSGRPEGSLWLLAVDSGEITECLVTVQGEAVSPFKVNLVNGGQLGFVSDDYLQLGFAPTP